MPRSFHKHELDRRVARALSVSRGLVAQVTTEFLDQLSHLLVESGQVTIEGFGSFKVEVAKCGKEVLLTKGRFKKGQRAGTMKVEVPSYVRVNFSKSKKLKELLDESFKE